jgi:hypothetical protein
MFPRYEDWNIKYTPKGLAKRRTRITMRYIAYALVIAGIYSAKRKEYGIKNLPGLVTAYMRLALLMGARTLQRIAEKV